MKYQNYKLWLTVELDSVDYQRISAFLHTKLLEQYKANAKNDVVNYFNINDIDIALKDENELNYKLASSILFFLKYKEDLINDSSESKLKISNSKKIKITKNDKLKDVSSMSSKISRYKDMSIIKIDKIVDDNTLFVRVSDELIKITIKGNDVLNSEEDLLFAFANPIKTKIKRSDKLKSRSFLKLSTLMRKDNTLNDLQNFTLESLKDKNLYYIGYIQL